MKRLLGLTAAAVMVLGAAACSSDAETANAARSTESTAGDSTSTSTTETTTSTTAITTTTTLAASDYRFPIEPESAASYSNDHHTYPAVDMFADCGTPIVSPTNGEIVHARAVDQWNEPEDNPAYRGGLSFAVLGVDGVRYYGSHLERLDVEVGQQVQAGDPIGLVGRSGNAADTPCHMHFGISPTCPGVEWKVRRGVIWPQPYLDDWRAGGARSPVEEIESFARSLPDACEARDGGPDSGSGRYLKSR